MAFSHLPTLDAQPARACPKPEPRKRTKGRKDRAEAKVKKSVRAQCVERDGNCRCYVLFDGGFYRRDDQGAREFGSFCHGSSEWAHMHTKRRSKTRGQAPEVRHTTAASLMLCQRHHDQYDGRQSPRLVITALTRRGADGPLKFRSAK